ncbi:MAG TPA: DUF4214 domain-containing protein, partial [Gemmataceae bacterium]|nr:DUF4214 domain-containing protein [Gemmataceae bacterium]
GTPEYFNNDAPALIGSPASDTTWVEAVYKQLFPNYTISQNEINYWDGLLGSGQITTTQAAYILDTSSLYRFGNIAANPANYVNGSINRAYVSLMGRNATPAEITFWEQVYAANPTYRIEDLQAGILGSAEFFAKNSTANTPLGSQDQQWADALYTDLLGSTNSAAEQNIDLVFLGKAEYAARLQITTAVTSVPEFHTDVTDFVYENYLHRAPNANELAFWAPTVGQQAAAPGAFNGDEQLLNGVLSSPEYFNLQTDPSDGGLHTDNSWLLSLYTSLRVPVNNSQELAQLNTLIADYAPARLAAIQSFFVAPEYMADFVQTEYNALLGRSANANELAFMVGQMQGGATQEQIIAMIISSPEFFNRAPKILNQNVPASYTTLVEAAYQVLFPNYTISQNEINFWVGELNSGAATPLSMAQALDTSSLYFFGASPTTGNYLNGFVNRTYLKFMGRNASQGEINYWMSAFTSTPNLIAAILDSTEYFRQLHQFP